MKIYVFLDILIIFIIMTYFCYFINRLINNYSSKEINALQQYIIMTVIIIIIFYIRMKFLSYAVLFTQLLLVCLILEGLLFLLKNNKYYNFFHKTGILLLIVILSLVMYDEQQMSKVVQKTYQLTSNKIDTLKVLQITDLHMSDSMSIDQIEDYCQQMDDLDIDIVFLTGDIFEETTTLSDMHEVARILGKIKNHLGIYYIYGNHDTATKNGKSAFSGAEIRTEFEKNNINVLEDEVVTINNITVIGRDNIGIHKKRKRLSMTELLSKVDLGSYIIVLDHQPLELKSNASQGVDLQLSGHTHGGKSFPLEYIASLFTEELAYGKKTIHNFTAITSSGMSFSKRTGAPNEFVYIVINK